MCNWVSCIWLFIWVMRLYQIFCFIVILSTNYDYCLWLQSNLNAPVVLSLHLFVINLCTYILHKVRHCSAGVLCSVAYISNIIETWAVRLARWTFRQRRCYGHPSVSFAAHFKLACGCKWRHRHISCSCMPKWTDCRLMIRCMTVYSQLCLLQCLHPRVLLQTVVGLMSVLLFMNAVLRCGVDDRCGVNTAQPAPCKTQKN